MADKKKSTTKAAAKASTSPVREDPAPVYPLAPAPKLPKWLSQRDDGIFVIDPDLAYPAIFAALGVDKPDQYWTEVAYQSAKMEVQRLIVGTELAPEDAPLEIHVNTEGDRKERWSLANMPEGRGVEVATKGREARVHYERIIGRF